MYSYVCNCKVVLTVNLLLLLLVLRDNVLSLTVDNQLVSARNDCFERIALEAMLPFERSFHTEDTNSLKTCKEKCIQAGDKCQTIAFGVHRRGNGTCQLSAEKLGMSGGRPGGTIFDPDFDLYSRKTNCFDLSDNMIPVADAMAYDSTLPSQTPPQVQYTSSHMESGSPLWLMVNPTTNPTTTTMKTTTMTADDRFPAMTTFFSSGGGGYSGTSSQPTASPETTMGPTTTTYGRPTTNGDRLYFSQELYPLYKYPMLYEQNYPAPNQAYYPGGYAANVPEVENHHKLPGHSMDEHSQTAQTHEPPRPIFGLGYGTGYSYGKPVKYDTTTRPYDHPADKRPGQSDQGGSEYATRPFSDDRIGFSARPVGSSSYNNNNNNRPSQPDFDYATAPYQPRPEYLPNTPSRPASSSTSNIRPSDFIDYTNRPDPSYSNQPIDGGFGSSSSRPPLLNDGQHPEYDYDYIRRNHNASRPDGYTYNDEKMIATFFNPDEYNQQGNRKTRPVLGDRDRYPTEPITACFRRVLAGKRIAPHWVRRTIACERVEECMRECGHEKRFICEGFNYRLDPSGHGQGDCELVEIPLAQIDLYSSAHRRDSNLLRHPDYDYYERDRNAPSSCRKSSCQDCPKPLSSSGSLYFKPSSGWNVKPYREEHYITALPSSSTGSYGADLYSHRRPSGETAVDRYRPTGQLYDTPPIDYHASSHDFSSHGYYDQRPPSSFSSSAGDTIDRYDTARPDELLYRPSRPDRWEAIPSGHDSSSGYGGYYSRPEVDHGDRFRPPFRPGPEYSPYRPILHHHDETGPSGPPPPNTYHSAVPPSSHASVSRYPDRDGPPPSSYKKPYKFVPYLIGSESDWGSYGGSYGGYSNSKHSHYWGLKDDNRRKDTHGFNYFELGGSREPPRETNSVLNYPGTRYGGHDSDPRDKHDYRHQWTRRPGPDECSAKTSEGFRLHKTVVKHSFTVPTITECEHLCSIEEGFICHTYSYRYNQVGRDNCMLCERPVNLLDYYIDIEPDRDYDIYSMADDLQVCQHPSRSDGSHSTALSDPRNAQCFFRAIDATRFFKSIVRDSLTVRSVGECELECIKSTKFTCRAFSYRYGQKRGHSGIIDNCQLSDWPVRDMDKERHLIIDPSFDVFERASYGHGCEIQPIVDDKHKKLCYLGYGSPAKLLSTAIKKVISVPTEVECKKECIRYRENTSFKCYSFSFGSHATTFNCEMSDLDQTELKLNVHYAHTHGRDYWLFAWNPFDWTCRDKVNTIGGTRVNNDRRMDIFREPGDLAWRHYTVSGKACRLSSPCEKNLITGFYSCEIDGGEIGSWDYCCKEDHPCGYSQGFDYPWCFVGDEPDQWRKCSDRYYPGNKTQQSHSSYTLPPTKDSKKKHQHSHTHEFQRPPRPGGLQSLNDFTAARLWPVTYLYSEGPPNSTEFSNFVDCNKETC